jgi:ADP-heptose:LPS heptosyltransferase
MATAEERILVIKLAALGDIVQALGPFAAIRRHHAAARITLLTTAPYAPLMRRAPCFDSVSEDTRPRWSDLRGWRDLRRWLRGGGFSRVYDLQTSDRSSFYFRLFWPGPWPEWSGIARGCSHPHANPRRDFLHTVERQADQLRMAGIAEVPAADLDWIAADVEHLDPGGRLALLVPGGAPHRPAKRWPVEAYGELASRLAARGLTPLVLGSESETAVGRRIVEACPSARDLTGRTDLVDLVGLARRAAFAVGNDTGPMHLIAAAGCRSVILYSAESDPALCGQRGPAVDILRRADLAALAVDEVDAVLRRTAAEPPMAATGSRADGQRA